MLFTTHGKNFLNFYIFSGHFAPKKDTIMPLNITVQTMHGGVCGGKY